MGEEDLPVRQPYPAEDPAFTVRRVPLEPEEVDNYYLGMANQVLWPVSHYMTEHLVLNKQFFFDYREVNRRFAEAVIDEYEPGDRIWINDYHLMLAPKYIREELPGASISQFWHIPWPAMEVYRILPWSRDLLRGMLGCDVIGFHVQEYVDNFIQSARVLLGAEVGDGVVHWEGRTVRVEAHPLGIDVERFHTMAAQAETDRGVQELRDETGVEHLIVGIDRLDYTKGILSRLLAFEQFLKDSPEYRQRVCFYQIATPSRTELPAYQQLKREVDEAVGRINGAFGVQGWVPVHYRYRTYTQQELCSFYRAADVVLITPLRDGMNLVAQEFVTASKRGVLALSELTGAAYILPEALLVNPYDHDSLSALIKRALEMPLEEQHERLRLLKERVQQLDVHRWASQFLDAMPASISEGRV